MNKSFTRRTALNLAAVSTLAGTTGCISERVLKTAAMPTSVANAADSWSRTHDRVWLGGEFWANPMEDWRIVDGAAECRTAGGNPDSVGLPHSNRPQHRLPNTGEYLDGFGNKTYVYAVGNSIVSEASNPYIKAHEKGSGFGFITFDTEKRTYHLESFRFLIDVTDGKPGNQFAGWPVTIHQQENRGENRLG